MQHIPPQCIQRGARLASAALIGAALLGVGVHAGATNPEVVFPPKPERLRAVRYAAMDKKRCLRELDLRGIEFKPGPKAPNVDAPVRPTSSLHGVRLAFSHRYVTIKKQPPPVMDCRLLLALDDLATLVKDRGFVAIRYNSVYRGRFARKPGERHPAGVAIDVVGFEKQSGEILDVLDDFHGQGVGSKTCGLGAPKAPAGKAAELRQLVCAIDEARIFNLILTPHYDKQHQNHFHLEVRRKIHWFLTQ